MRMSRIFSRTRRQAQAAAETASHDLLVRAGYIRQLGAGIFSYLPLGLRALRNIELILREEMDAIGGQEIEMPVVNPADIWKETRRFYEVGEELTRLTDRADRDLVLAMTHEEVVGSLVRDEVRSYRQLPQVIYQIQTKWRDDPRPRAGLIRVREFAMKDSYSLDRDWDGLDRAYDEHFQAYLRIFARCGLPVRTVESDTGMMGGKEAHEFMYETSIGEDTLIICDACGYTANRQVATFRKPTPEPERELPAEKVATPDVQTIEDLTVFLDVPAERTAKAVFMMGTFAEGDDEERQQLIFAVVRGDMDVNDTKLANASGVKRMRPATEEEIRTVGAVPGYASPVGVKGALVIVDDIIPTTKNLVSGANEAGYHTKNVNYGRDFTADIVTDIAVAAAGAPCPECGEALRATRGVEVGNIFKLGTRYSDAMGLKYLDEDGTEKTVIMGSYGIGVGRLLACLIEEYHDENGLTLPVSVSPYQVYLVDISRKSDIAGELYESLTGAGVSVLFDDRAERAGVKFNDADLIGPPIRITVGDRSLAKGEVEMKLRRSGEERNVPTGDLVQTVKDAIEEMRAELSRRAANVSRA